MSVLGWLVVAFFIGVFGLVHQTNNGESGGHQSTHSRADREPSFLCFLRRPQDNDVNNEL